MKRLLILFLLLAMLLSGCSSREAPAQIAATTLPVYEFTTRLCEGTPLIVTRLVTENVSCLHDYSLNVRQVKAVEAAELIVINGAGLEEFMEDLLHSRTVLDASVGISLHSCADSAEEEHHGHHHEADSHIWLSPDLAITMASNICQGLSSQYPEHASLFEENLISLTSDLEALGRYADSQLSSLTTRDLVTFHDGFHYLAESCDLHILQAVEEESGREASASQLKQLICLVRDHHLPAIFTEVAGSVSAASVISAETGAKVYSLDMAMSGDSYFEAMYHNIDTLKEALQ